MNEENCGRCCGEDTADRVEVCEAVALLASQLGGRLQDDSQHSAHGLLDVTVDLTEFPMLNPAQQFAIEENSK